MHGCGPARSDPVAAGGSNPLAHGGWPAPGLWPSAQSPASSTQAVPIPAVPIPAVPIPAVPIPAVPTPAVARPKAAAASATPTRGASGLSVVPPAGRGIERSRGSPKGVGARRPCGRCLHGYIHRTEAPATSAVGEGGAHGHRRPPRAHRRARRSPGGLGDDVRPDPALQRRRRRASVRAEVRGPDTRARMRRSMTMPPTARSERCPAGA